MATVYLALGSNVGNTLGHVTAAQAKLQKVLDCAVSAPLYTTKAVGHTDQADFLNTVVCGQTALSPEKLLKFVKKVELELGRIKRFRWGPREIDIDIIFYDDIVAKMPDLTLPHPRYAERDFVLRPLCDLCGDLMDPRTQKPVKLLLEKIPATDRSILG